VKDRNTCVIVHSIPLKQASNPTRLHGGSVVSKHPASDGHAVDLLFMSLKTCHYFKKK
jgi:hypothetical protein